MLLAELEHPRFEKGKRDMQTRHIRRLGAVAAVAAIGATGVVSAGAASGRAGSDQTATIDMVAKGKDLLFEGPRKVEAGSQLDIVNKTDPEQVGPHTFTLVEKDELPQTKDEIKQCEHVKSEFCANIVKKHKADPKTGEIGKPSLDYGKKGWDTEFGKKGDSWVTVEQDESQARKVSAKPGTTLYYFCLVHPFMQGKIKVVK
jgi:hypothetical protein